MLDIHYHRPEEVIGEKHFPEQEEVTVVFLCDLKEARQVKCMVLLGGVTFM